MNTKSGRVSAATKTSETLENFEKRVEEILSTFTHEELAQLLEEIETRLTAPVSEVGIDN